MVDVRLFTALPASFAGEDYDVAVVPAEARKLLAHFDERSVHYETIAVAAARDDEKEGGLDMQGWKPCAT